MRTEAEGADGGDGGGAGIGIAREWCGHSFGHALRGGMPHGNAFANALAGAAHFQVKTEAAQIGRINLRDRVADPDDWHRRAFEQLIDPPLARATRMALARREIEAKE